MCSPDAVAHGGRMPYRSLRANRRPPHPQMSTVLEFELFPGPEGSAPPRSTRSPHVGIARAGAAVVLPLVVLVATAATALRPAQVVPSPTERCAQVAGPSAEGACHAQMAHLPTRPPDVDGRSPLVQCAHLVVVPTEVNCRELEGP